MIFVKYGNAEAPTVGHQGDMTAALRYVVDAHPEEPLFILRGRDILAPSVISTYESMADLLVSQEMANQVNLHLERFTVWQAKYPAFKKYPDPYPGWKG